jgi:purine-cytosine permease-like protein
MTTESLGNGGVDQVGQIETRGVDYIPEAERHSRPRELSTVFFGTQLCFGIIVLGFLPVSFGLGWWGSVSSTLVGLAIGSALFAPLALLSTRTGTNSAVSSGAHFGVVGRIVGSLVGIFTAIGFYALTVWTGGQALVEGLHKLIGMPNGAGEFVVAYAIIAALTLVVAIYGHANVVLANRILIPTMGILLIVGVIILAPKFTTSPQTPELLLGNYPATWLLSATTAASLPISYCPYIGDYTRYISAKKWSSRRIVASAFIGMFIGTAVALCFAIYSAMGFAPGMNDWVAGLVDVSPTGFTAAIVVIALVGSCAQGALCVYGTGLDTSSIFPSLKRVPATLLIGLAGTVLVYIGFFVYNLVSAATAFLVILLVVTAPWVVIGIVSVIFMAVANAAPITAMTGNVPIAVGFGNGLGAPAGFLFATIALTLFALGYVGMAKHITTTGAFYGFISHGLGQIWGTACWPPSPMSSSRAH